MNAIEIEHQLYLLSNEISDYNKKIKDCQDEIKDNLDMKNDARKSVQELFKQLKENYSLGNYEEVEELKSKYNYLLNT